MQTDKIIYNKFYLYAGKIVKIKKINKSTNKVLVENIQDNTQTVLPYQQGDILLKRIYTVGEVSKIVEKRPDTIRKYEKKGLIPTAKKFGDDCRGYSAWRYYNEDEVYEMVEFFNSRTPGRPSTKITSVNTRVKTLAQKVQLKHKEKNVN